MLTKKDLLAYKKQNPAKYAHKFGHINLDELPDEGLVQVEKAKTEIDGSPARPTIPWNHPSNGGKALPEAVQAPLEPSKPVEAPVQEPVIEATATKEMGIYKITGEVTPMDQSEPLEVGAEYEISVALGDQLVLDGVAEKVATQVTEQNNESNS